MPASSVRVPDRVAPPLKPEPAHAEAAIARMVGGEPYRRGVLEGLTALAASLPAQIAAASGAAHPDAELLDLWQHHVRARERVKAASERCRAIDDATAHPEPPQALFARDEDDRFGFLRLAQDREDGRLWYVVGWLNTKARAHRLRDRQTRRVRRLPRPEEGLPEYVREIEEVVPWPEAQARADQIVSAWDAWVAEMTRIEAKSGILEADQEHDDLDDARIVLELAIRDAKALTLAGIRVKAQLAALDLDEDRKPDPKLMAGLVRDLLAIGLAA